MRWVAVALAGIVIFTATCDSPSELPLPEGPSFEIMDGARSGNPHFFFLPPLVRAPQFSGKFDGSPKPTVQICAWEGACVAVIATYTMATGPGSETVRVVPEEELYVVNWRTGQFGLDPAKTYRIRVLLGSIELGRADVDVVRSGNELKNVDSQRFVGLVSGSTLPIKFRIQEGTGIAFIGREGGTVRSSDGRVTLLIPLGAVPEETAIGIQPPADALPDDAFYLAGTAFDFLPDGMRFAQPVTVTIAYAQANVPANVRESELAIHKLIDGAWSEVPGSVVDAETNTIAASIMGFSAYGGRAKRVASVTVSPSSATIEERQTLQLTATPRDASGNALNRPVTWSSSDQNLAAVDGIGLVTAVAPGVVTITATSEGVSASAQITIEASVAAVEVTPSTATLEVGQTLQLAATPRAASGQALNRPVSWGGQDESIATVSAEGLVTAIAPGTTSITAAAGGQTGSAIIRVLRKLSNIRLAPEEAVVLPANDVVDLTAFEVLADGSGAPITDRYLTWSSSDPSVATIEQPPSGDASATVERVNLNGGFTVITVADPVSGKSSSAKVLLQPVAAASVTIDGPKSVLLYESATLTATVRDSRQRVITGRPVTWSYSSTGGLLIKIDGTSLTATAVMTPGSLTVQAFVPEASAPGGISSSPLTLTVQPQPVSSIRFQQSDFTLEVDQSSGVGVELLDAFGRPTGGPKTMEWSTVPGGVIGVSGATYWCCAAPAPSIFSTNVRALQLGSTTLTAHVDGLEASIAITVVGDFSAISAGSEYTCGVSGNATSTVYCWGNNVSGQLGTTGGNRPTPRAVLGNYSFRVITTSHGDYRHTCGLLHDGKAYCWGDNRWGQLGDGNNNASYTPVPVSGGLSFTAISAGYYHTCALTTDGQAYCWGLNIHGQRGDGSNNASYSPVLVAGNLRFSAIAAGAGHTCAISTQPNHAAYCWGLNTYGARGDGSDNTSFTPVLVAGGRGYKAITAGEYHTCAIGDDDRAYCWGYGPVLGTGDNNSRLEPVPVALGTVTGIAAGNYYNCALDTSGGAWCWGGNDYGRLGDGTNNGSLAPVRVRDQSVAFTHVSAGITHTCAVAVNGKAYCWGSNDSGQIGDGASGNVYYYPKQVIKYP
ncbi:MAG: Ig-like domain-containing protein [Gemmatimonadetes bacterium]|nr:Ig-like domain-containing protein [Gemmatimonadota bacterium]